MLRTRLSCVLSVICLFTCLLTAPAWAGDLRQLAAVPATNAPEDVAVGLLDGGGNIDLVIANTGTNTVTVCFGNGDGTFGSCTDYSLDDGAGAADNPSFVILVDVDGDTDLDIVAANKEEDISLLLNDGTGVFGAVASDNFGGTDPTGLATADFDGDGNPDIIVTNDTDIFVFLNTGDFTDETTVFATGSRVTTNAPDLPSGGSAVLLGSVIPLGDLNADGDEDIAIADKGNDRVNFLYGNGDGSFDVAGRAIANIARVNATSIVTVDTTAAHGFANGQVVVVSGVTDASFNGTFTITSIVDADTFTYTQAGADAADTTGSVTNVLSLATGTDPVAFTYDDVTGDLTKELIVAHSGSSDLRILNYVGLFTLGATIAVDAPPFDLGVGKFSSDTNNDIVVSTSDGVRLFLNSNVTPGTFGAARSYATGVALKGGDGNNFNGGAGFADAAIADPGGNQARIFLGGPFENVAATAFSPTEGIAFSGQVATFDHDNPAKTTASFNTSTIDWDDPNAPGLDSPTGFGGATPSFTMDGAHTYADPDATFKTGISAISRTGGTATVTTTTSDHGFQAGDSVTIAGVAAASFNGTFTITGTPAANQFTYALAGTASSSGGTATIGAHQPVIVITDDDGESWTLNHSAAVSDTPVALAATPVSSSTTVLSGVSLATITDTNTTAEAAHFNHVTALGTPALVSAVDWDNNGTNDDNCSDNAGTTPNCVISGTTGGPFTVNGSHTYPDFGSYTAKLTVTDTEGGGAATSFVLVPITIASVTIDDFGSLPQTINEGATLSGTIAHFTSADATSQTSDFTGLVQWGDGNSDNCSDNAGTTPNCVISGGPGLTQYVVTGTHPYLDEGTYDVTITITDNCVDVGCTISGSVNQTLTSAVTVNDVPFAVGLTAGAPSTTEGDGTTFFTGDLATFTEGNPAATNGYTGTVDWNNDTIPDENCSNVPGVTPNCVISAAGTVVARHAFPTLLAPGPLVQPVVLTITDVGGVSYGPVTVNVTVNNAVIVVDALDINPTENTTFSGVIATITDANPTTDPTEYTGEVDWDNDGIADDLCSFDVLATPDCVISYAGTPGNFNVTGQNFYSTLAAPPVGQLFKVSLKDAGAATLTSDTATATVVNQPIAVTAQAFATTENTTVTNQLIGTLVDTNPTTDPSEYTGNIDWDNDGTPETVCPSVDCVITYTGTPGQYDITANHFYPTLTAPAQTSQTFNLSLKDAGRADLVSDTAVATVNNQPIAVTAQPLNVTEGQSFTLVIATLVDTNPTTSPAEYTGSVDWNNDGTPDDNCSSNAGTTPNCVISGPTGGPGQYNVTGTHTYPTLVAPGPLLQTYNVSLKDAGSAVLTSDTDTATINDAVLGPFTANDSIPCPGPAPACQGIEPGRGSGALPITLGFFTDANGAALPGDYTITVDWGDGTPTSPGDGLPITVTLISGCGASPCVFQIDGSHDYVTAAALFDVNITITSPSGQVLGGPALPAEAVIYTSTQGGGAGAPLYTPTVDHQSANVTPGGVANFNLTLFPTPGLPPAAGPVFFSCPNLRPGMSCEFFDAVTGDPLPLADDGTGTLRPFVPDVDVLRCATGCGVAVAVHTTAPTAMNHSPFGGLSYAAAWLPMSGFGLFGILLLTPAGRRRRTRRMLFWTMVSLLFLTLALVGCGGGGFGPSGNDPNVTPSGPNSVLVRMTAPNAPVGSQTVEFHVIVNVTP